MRGTDDAHIDRHLGHRTDAAHGTLLDHAQQFALHGQRQVADLVQEQRAALGGLEEAFTVFVGAGEGTLAVAEEFSFEQRFGDGAAIHGHEGAGGARRTVVDGARHQFLAGARLAVHQHRRHAAPDLFHQAAHLHHGRRVAQQPLQRAAPRRRAAHRRGSRHSRGRRACAPRRAPQGRGHDGAKLPQVHRFGEVVVGAGLERLDSVFRRPVGGDDDRLFAPCSFVDASQQIQPGAVGQAHVGDHELIATRPALLQQRPAFLDRGRALDVVALAQQCQFVQRAQVGLVVDNEQAGAGWRAQGRGCSVVSGLSGAGAGAAPTVAARRMLTTNSLRSRSAAGRGRYSMLAP